VYYFGIVDFLQDWTFNKRVERNAKIYVMRKDPAGLSVMEPVGYKLRFQRKMRQIFDMDNSIVRQLSSPSSSPRSPSNSAVVVTPPTVTSSPPSSSSSSSIPTTAKISRENNPSLVRSTQTQEALIQPTESNKNVDDKEEDTEEIYDTDM